MTAFQAVVEWRDKDDSCACWSFQVLDLWGFRFGVLGFRAPRKGLGFGVRLRVRVLRSAILGFRVPLRV